MNLRSPKTTIFRENVHWKTVVRCPRLRLNCDNEAQLVNGDESYFTAMVYYILNILRLEQFYLFAFFKWVV